MTLSQLRERVLAQTGRDTEELSEVQPRLDDFLNEAYDRLSAAFDGTHLSGGERMPLRAERSSPDLPEWTHSAMADWAVWMLMRAESPRKQAMGQVFQVRFLETERKLRSMTDTEKGLAPGRERAGLCFFNLPD